MIRLNKFISNSGLCTRREADDYIIDGRVHVDNQIVTTLGYKVSIDSEIRVDNKIIVPYSFQYIVLNKPVDFNFNSKKNIFDLIKSSEIDNLGLLEMVKDDFKGLVLFSNDNEYIRLLFVNGSNILPFLNILFSFFVVNFSRILLLASTGIC